GRRVRGNCRGSGLRPLCLWVPRRPRLRAAGAAAAALRARLFGLSRLPARSALPGLSGLSDLSGLPGPAVRVALRVALRRPVALRARLWAAPICLSARAPAHGAVGRAAERGLGQSGLPQRPGAGAPLRFTLPPGVG